MAEVNRQWLLNGRPDEKNPVLKDEFFKYNEAPKPVAGPGELVVRTIYFACDPSQQGWMRGKANYMNTIEIGDVMFSRGTGLVVESNHPDYQVGDRVAGMFGWQDYFLTGGIDLNGDAVRKLPADLPLADNMGALGSTGMTAYFGLIDVGELRPGDTVLISGAAGAVGSIAGQIAKLAGCKVIGIAGGKAKCDWVVDDLGFDACIDYKAEKVRARIGELAPEKVNLFFDNVGGPILEDGLAHLAMNARVALCGGIAGYTQIIPGPQNYMQLVFMRCKMEGFIVLDYHARFPEARARLRTWIEAGQMKDPLDIKEGFNDVPQIYLGLFTGANFGKQLIKIADDPTA